MKTVTIEVGDLLSALSALGVEKHIGWERFSRNVLAPLDMALSVAGKACCKGIFSKRNKRWKT